MRSRGNLFRAFLPLLGVGLLLNGCADTKSPSSSSSSSNSGGGPEIVIGEYASMTGKESTFGSSQDSGVQTAVAELNKAGGIDGVKIRLVGPEDDESKSEAAQTSVIKLITQDKVMAVIGEVASKNSIAAASPCSQNKVPMISPSSTNPKLTLIGPYIFRVCFIDPFQGTVAAKFALNNLKAKRAAILTDATGDYSIGLTQFFKEAFIKGGGTVVVERKYNAGDPDFKAQLAAIKSANPDILFVPGYYTEVGTIAKQARELGLTVPLLGGDGWDSPKLIEGAGGPGKALEGSYFTNHASMDSPDPTIQKFVKSFEADNSGKKPDSITALSYDAVMLLADAIKRAGKPADGNYNSPAYREKVRDALAATKDFAGVTGKITLGPTRDAVKSAVVLQVKGNDFAYNTTINP